MIHSFYEMKMKGTFKTFKNAHVRHVEIQCNPTAVSLGRGGKIDTSPPFEIVEKPKSRFSRKPFPVNFIIGCWLFEICKFASKLRMNFTILYTPSSHIMGYMLMSLTES